MNPVTILAVLLGISVLVSSALGIGYLGQRDKAVEVEGQRDAARAQAQQCSDATDKLAELAAKRSKAAASARAAAAATAKGLDQRADYTLAAQPKDPANACASMQALADEWIKGRVQK